MKFIKLKEQIVNADSIIKVDYPKKVSAGIEWSIRTLLDTTKTQESLIYSTYTSEATAVSEYERIVNQLCSDK